MFDDKGKFFSEWDGEPRIFFKLLFPLNSEIKTIIIFYIYVVLHIVDIICKYKNYYIIILFKFIYCFVNK